MFLLQSIYRRGLLAGHQTQAAKRCASKKQGGKSKNGRDSQPKYRGFKLSDGQPVIPGNIIIRQKGALWHPGEGVKMGKDYTIYAVHPGFVSLVRRRIQKYDFKRKRPFKILKFVTVATERKNIPELDDIR